MQILHMCCALSNTRAMSIREQTRLTRESSLGWMIQRLAGQLNVEMGRRLAELDLQLPQFAVMMMVLEHEPLSQADIGKRFGMPPYAISRALDGLQTLGFIERKPNPSSRRAHVITSTKAGQTLAPKLHAIVRQANGDLLQDFDAEDQAKILGLLGRLVT